MTFTDLEKLIYEATKTYKVYLTLATNSLKVGFFRVDEKKADFYLWIDPPWRITQNSLNVINSYNYPYHSNYSDDERDQEKKDFLHWAAQADEFRNNLQIEKVKISSKGELGIQFQNGYELDVYTNDTEEYSWYFRDNTSEISFEVTIGKIVEHKEKTEEA